MQPNTPCDTHSFTINYKYQKTLTFKDDGYTAVCPFCWVRHSAVVSLAGRAREVNFVFCTKCIISGRPPIKEKISKNPWYLPR